jgi:hypothetical protein
MVILSGHPSLRFGPEPRSKSQTYTAQAVARLEREGEDPKGVHSGTAIIWDTQVSEIPLQDDGSFSRK